MSRRNSYTHGHLIDQVGCHSRQPESFAAKILAAMRKGFGGHAVQKAEG